MLFVKLVNLKSDMHCWKLQFMNMSEIEHPQATEK